MGQCGGNRNDVVSIMWKTVSDACNLACDYCYYKDCEGSMDNLERIEPKLLEKFIKDYMAQTNGGAVFTWQGGEPLLAGLDFFQNVVDLQGKYAPKNTIISNSIQTNGTLIDAHWAQFFRTYRFVVGISIDGPKEMHDKRRKTGSGAGSFQQVMAGVEQLRRHHVPFTVLTVLHEGNITEPDRLMEFYEKNGFMDVQFLPCMEFMSQEPGTPGKYAITPRQYGDFLCRVFDRWYKDGSPTVNIRFFDNILRGYLRLEMESCTQREDCPKVLVLEQNGDAYPCDFYISEEYKLGNVGDDTLEEILHNPVYWEFLQLKGEMAEECKECDYLHLCHGGCPRNRYWASGEAGVGSGGRFGAKVESDAQSTSTGVDYFCQSYRQLFSHAHRRMERLGAKVKREWITDYIVSGRRLPARNDRCLCGSGEKFKACCLKYA
ncbi:MAG: anaerobic sulfatase maturase [Bacillus sp. (in: Bacteria)]|nr:anaerobic sulfatase maturase [Bacillus sp. (in: firmicutes)]